MKLSTFTNLLLGGIATMAFNSFTSTPTFVMAHEYVNDEETPQDFYGCVEKFTDGFEDLSYNDVMDCTVSIENVWEKCPYFLLDYNDYVNATNVPFNFPDDYAACKALNQCAYSVYAIDECFGDEGIDMEGMLANIKDVDVDDVMNAYNAENYDYVSGVFKEIITYGRENNVTDPSIQKSIMCIADNFL
ncbi:hypothetical protein FRACYDRAFT_265869 [Fragilariopsis cylindrus CCMP1102]|uniref:Uncharacterized protein n=1 Tax=Fragilariopsis cylindrus CCMP1102 TaxID=635003 RepID=A0A1E7EKT9_9STRA|nr:hypothetical protein FRACYDRAFT_265869 [Fragilariopsis cylindrus CCMP1102]|eukprot:OEU06518.1 hypothetical protein FRACYDRAFT_265869 [Fragilariopsis cylindrus CCMP1102]